MIQLIIGEKGKGKTKILLEKANAEIKAISGNMVYLDKSTQHMYELNNRIRLIDVSAYPIENVDAFQGFLCGILSQDNDLEQIYLDSFLKIAGVDEAAAPAALEKMQSLSEKFNVTIVISVSVTKEQLPESLQGSVIQEC